jgi:adenylyl-sulfate kinase
VKNRRLTKGGSLPTSIFSKMHTDHVFWSKGDVSTERRWTRNGHKGCVVWLTGLSGSGKSTLTRALEGHLFARGMQTFVLDGDNLRHGLNSDLGFLPADRMENIRRVAEVAALLASAGQVCLISLISPYLKDRLNARRIAQSAGSEFVEVFVDAPLDICEQRDPKNLYKRARAGEIHDFTGVDAPYELPENPETHVRTNVLSIEASVELIVTDLLPRLQLGVPSVAGIAG